MQGLEDLEKSLKRIGELYAKIQTADYSEVNTIEREVKDIINYLPFYSTHVYRDISRVATQRRAELQKVQFNRVMDIPEPDEEKQVEEVKEEKPKTKKAKKAKKGDAEKESNNS